ncbi:MetQ/NlpA family ABC transporter substrate-binding protein [Tenuibacillus multivorans]|uniref:Lipoprotein n=1 Tax=Tenuibacillus multivorans TaxID=237069 RepID=A0A1H0DAK4_9BACI|nr:MetQ/NlpA family ABC transporter substrate-binding protein [Tenuibacillus multivorans]GEL76638.1 lipoprotein [Tenuibacillus multivorans]SDN67011.1 D-methionine transport system substrate-binding protein [Tenuibacillus multivorans]
MKKLFSLLAITLLAIFLVACGTAEEENNDTENDNASGDQAENQEENAEQSEEDAEELVEITVGATSVPHAEVLEQAKPILEEEGIELNIEVYQEYILPNEDLSNGTLDANYYQHIPYLNDQKAEFGYDFVNLGGIHIEPMGVYSKNITNLEDIPEGTDVIMSRSVADHGRILSLLQEHGLIKLKDDVEPISATIDDIAEDGNPLNLEFDASIEPGLLPEFYNREEDALVAINTNYAIEAGLVPSEDALILEGSESPYVNVVAARSEDENNEALQTLVEVLRSEEIQTFIEEEYEGAVVPVSE